MGRAAGMLAVGLAAIATLALDRAAAAEKPVPQGKAQVLIDNASRTRSGDFPAATYLYQFCIESKTADGTLVVLRRDAKGRDTEALRLDQPSCANILVADGEVISAGTLSAEVKATFRLLCVNNGVGGPVCLP